MKIGYARVSTLDQHPESQQDALKAKGCDRVYVDHYTGTATSRPEWDKAKEALRPGDHLVCTRLDRLGRSTKDLLAIAEWLKDSDIALEVTEQSIDTSTPEGELFFTLIAAFAQFERSLLVSRTKDGLAAARARGRTGGRKAALSAKQVNSIRELYKDGSGATITDLAEQFKVSRPTIYRAVQTA